MDKPNTPNLDRLGDGIKWIIYDVVNLTGHCIEASAKATVNTAVDTTVTVAKEVGEIGEALVENVEALRWK